MSENLERLIGQMQGDMRSLSHDVGGIKASMTQLADAMTKIARMEERHQSQVEATDKLETRVHEVEKVSTDNSTRITVIETKAKTTIWVIRALWSVVGAGILGIVAKVLGLL